MSTSHKEKIIRVLQLFQTTDEKTPMNAVQISQKLEEEYGMENVHRTSIYDDVRLLQSCGYPIKQAENSHKGWYMEKHLLEDWEIKLMLDSVQQARCVSVHEANEIRNKLLNLTSQRGRSRFSHMIMPLPGNVRGVGQIGEYIEIMLEAMYLHNAATTFPKPENVYRAKVPITFGYDTDTLGSYTRRSAHEKEHFHFSLLFIAYGVKNPLSKEDRIDLFKHEYAHYMQYNMQIPEKYKWQAGTHGSAWKYCCSLIGAAPTPYYKAGEALMNHDYDKVLKNRIHDKSVPVRDTYQQLKTAQKKKDEVVQYKLGDAVTHPKFGHGIVEKINQRSGGVHLHIRFDGEVKCIDQKWLSRKKYM